MSAAEFSAGEEAGAVSFSEESEAVQEEVLEEEETEELTEEEIIGSDVPELTVEENLFIDGEKADTEEESTASGQEEDFEVFEAEEELLAASDSISTAATISFGKVYNGVISESNTADYYKFSISEPGAVTLQSVAYLQYVKYMLYDADGTKIWNDWPEWNATGQITEKTPLQLTKGTYYIGVLRDDHWNHNGVKDGDYNLKISFVSAKESFPEAGKGSNNSIETANSISVNKTYRSQLAVTDLGDYYKFTMPKSGFITLTTKEDSSVFLNDRVHYAFYDKDGKKCGPRLHIVKEEIFI